MNRVLKLDTGVLIPGIERVTTELSNTPILLDIGFRQASAGGVNPAMWARAVSRMRGTDVTVILPDSLHDAGRTRNMSVEALRRLRGIKHSIRNVVYVVHETARAVWNPELVAEEIGQVAEEAGNIGVSLIVGVPTHVMDVDARVGVRCSVKPDTCSVIARAIASLALRMGLGVHLLGPPMHVAKKLVGVATSIDATAYRRAPTNALRSLNNGYTSPRSDAVSSAWAVYWVARVVGYDENMALTLAREAFEKCK